MLTKERKQSLIEKRDALQEKINDIEEMLHVDMLMRAEALYPDIKKGTRVTVTSKDWRGIETTENLVFDHYRVDKGLIDLNFEPGLVIAYFYKIKKDGKESAHSQIYNLGRIISMIKTQ